MRCSGWSSLAISVCSALALGLAPPASAHVVAMPPFVAAGGDATISLSAPNERSEPMTGFTVTVPSGFAIFDAHAPGWTATVEGSTATWTGSTLSAGAEAEFVVQIEGPPEPGPAELEAEQLYPGGEIVRWPVALTVVPAAESPSQNLALAAAVGLIGLLVVAGIVAVAWWRRGRLLQER